MGKQKRYVKDNYRHKSNKGFDITRDILLIKNYRISSFQFRVSENCNDLTQKHYFEHNRNFNGR
jgi:aspartyl/asparaginyl beta-hydroxylase (cupin superfamily)